MFSAPCGACTIPGSQELLQEAPMMRMVVARLIVAILLGIAVGYAVGNSTAADAERGNALTMKAYIADFDHHKQELIASRVPMAAALLVGTLMIVAMFGLYELLVW